MAQKIFNTRIQTKRDTASNWEAKNPVLLNGEEIIVDTSAGEVRKKIGDGVKRYTQLPFTDEIIRDLINDKVDKVTGKGLSTNDYTTTEKNKLAGIAEGANKYTHPTSHNASMITQDNTHRFVTDTEKATWNAKASTAVATTTSNGLMSNTDKSEHNTMVEVSNQIQNGTYAVPKAVDAATVNGKTVAVNVPADAVFTDTVYTHPTSHNASMITQDNTHRFVTDTEKATWNAKASTAVATTTSNGLMSSADKTKLDGIADNANKYVHPTYTSKTAGLYKVTVDTTGHVSATTAVAKADITALGIPAQDTTYGVATASANGLMSKTDKSNLDAALTRIATLETNYASILAKLKTALFVKEV